MTTAPLHGRTALITGGGTGIGLACARAFVRDGAHVVLMGRSADKLEAGAAELRALAPAGAQVATVGGDVGVEADVEAAVARAVAIGGGLHIAVANAGTGTLGPIIATRTSDLEAVFRTNVFGTFHTFKHAGAAIARAGGGAMCAISSIAGVRTHRFMSVYCATKAAIDDLVRNAADELGVAGVRVNSVCPGLVDTDIAQGLFTDPAVHADYLACMPLGRTGVPDDIGRSVRFLCGPESAWITGVVLSVDGGHHLRRGPDVEPIARRLYAEDVLMGRT